ncbi:hypothetical protein RINTHM_4370 [Richelia intracellularis HM01]|nr:hypothetical protein RINTHM_4370 [Richelia intracellularis HM01]
MQMHQLRATWTTVLFLDAAIFCKQDNNGLTLGINCPKRKRRIPGGYLPLMENFPIKIHKHREL